jgi:RimJ/RimL family protein N-acetyltransferase
MTGPHVIRTPRLLLRRFAAGDAEPLHALFNDWEVVRWLSTPPWPYALDDARTYIAGQLQEGADERTFAITLDGALIGCVSARPFVPDYVEGAPPGPNLGYWLGRPFWGRGYMTEAARAFLAHLFASGAGDTVYSGAAAENRASLTIQGKLGFVRHVEGTHFFRPRGETLPHVFTRLERAAFEARAA